MQWTEPSVVGTLAAECERVSEVANGRRQPTPSELEALGDRVALLPLLA